MAIMAASISSEKRGGEGTAKAVMAAFKAGEVERKACWHGEGGRATEWPAGLAARRRERAEGGRRS